MKEHEDEFSHFRMAKLGTHEPVAPIPFDYAKQSQLDSATRAIAAFHALDTSLEMTARGRALAITTFGGSFDGRKALAFVCLMRRIWNETAHLGELLWPPYLIDELGTDIFVATKDFIDEEDSLATIKWEIAYAKLSGVQELAWFCGLEKFQYPMVELGSYVADEDWEGFLSALHDLGTEFRDRLIAFSIERTILGHRDLGEVIHPKHSKRVRVAAAITDLSVSVGKSKPIRHTAYEDTLYEEYIENGQSPRKQMQV
ncbi:MAG TPA: hypothetical protein PK156_27370 [Polyangium sp.]|nr:hypothetical protein [Polyangium sp.]